MGRYLLLLQILFSLIGFVNSQSLIDTSKVWNVMHNYKGVTTRCYKFTEDTVFGDTVFTRLNYSFSEDYNPKKSIFAGYLAEKDEKVFIKYYTGVTFMLYDFGAVQGDTIDLGMLNHSYPLFMRVDTSDYIEVEGQKSLRLFLSPIDDADAAPQQWIKGVGSTIGLVEVGEPQYFNFKTELLCLHHSDSVIWKGRHDFCYFSNAPERERITLVTGEQEEEKEDVILNKKIEDTNLLIKVYDNDGELILERKIKREKDLDFHDLEKGEYIIQLTDAFDRIYAFRKIKI